MLLLFLIMVGGYGGGALGALGARSEDGVRRLTALGALIGGGAGLALALGTLAAGAPFALEIPELLSVGGGLALRLDPLGAFFLLLTSAVGIPAALYGAGYSRASADGSSLATQGVMLNAFLLTMSLVPLADTVLTFLLFWEGMSLSSYLLVMTESGEAETVRAGTWYLAMTHGGVVLLLAAFMLAGGASAASFADLRSAAATLDSRTRSAVFLLALLGFGGKAGIIPLHVWLPRAHPAAPSHVSALMSGAMIKLGVYGLLRVGLDLLGGGPAWWGGLVLALGAVSAVLGVLYALMEHDLKRLLAYHSVENVGIIFIGIGAGLLFQSYGLGTLAVLALVGGLYHSINHACFKGLLFLGAGSVLHATGTRNMEEMGGLIKGMPRTAAAFLVGAVAISALPPLNGFVSEWLIFQALLAGFAIPEPAVAILMPLAVGLLALASGLAAACFVKAFGITFLAIPRSPAAEEAREVPVPMQVGMGALVLACIALGVAPFVVIPLLGRAIAGLGGLSASSRALAPGWSLGVPGTLGAMSPTAVALGLVLLVALIPLGLRLFGAERRLRVGDTWGCGRIGQTPRMQYTATAFAEPLRRVFAELYRPAEDLSIDFHPESRYFVQSIEYRSEILPWFDRYLYRPAIQAVRALAARVLAIQSGSVHAYLTYLVMALVVLLSLLLASER